MKSIAIIATILGAASGANLRTGGSAALNTAVIEQLATKYDCHAAAGDLVTTVNNIVAANTKERVRLTTACATKAATHEHDKLAAETTFTTSDASVAPAELETEQATLAEELAIFNLAKTKYCTPEHFHTSAAAMNNGCTAYGSAVNDEDTVSIASRKIASDSADQAALDATQAHTTAQTKYTLDAAQSETDKTAHATATETAKGAGLLVQTNADTASDTRVETDRTALQTTKETTQRECAAVKTARDAHIASDDKIVKAMKPLLQQLNICEGIHATEATPGLHKAGYRGVQSKTRSGKTCQKWTVQSPHHHTRTESEYPDKGLGDHNYCRNPDNEDGGIWCYTTEAGTRWEYCDPLAQSNSQSLSLVEVDTRAKCALTKKSMMSLLEVGGVPEGSFQEFRARVITETTYMNTAKNTCDGAANRLYNGEKTRHTGLWNTAKTFTAGQLTTKTEATTAFNAEVAIGEARMVSATSAKTAEEGTRDTARTAATTAATTAKSTAITDGQAEVTRTKTAAKNSIDNNAEQEATACTEGKENLLAEAALVRQMTEILNGGGTDGSDLRVVGDAVDGNNVRWYVGMHIYSHKVNGCVNGHNIIKYTDKSVEECKKLCDDYGPGCKAFEYGMNYGGGGGYLARDCQLQNSANSAGCNGAHHNLDLYTKTEPAPAGDAGITGLNTMTADTDFGTVSADLSATTSN